MGPTRASPSVQNDLKGVFGVSRTRSKVLTGCPSSLKKMLSYSPLPPTFMISKIITSVLVILPEMDEVHPRLTSYSEYLDTDKTSLVPQSGQKCRLHEILSAENGTNCNFYDKYESFLRCFNYFKPANFFQSVTKFVMNDKTAKNWNKMIIRKSYETINIAEKNYFSF